MSAYAIYRLPHEDHATCIRQAAGEPLQLHTLSELNGKQGFVVAPFEVTPQQPIMLIQGSPEIVDLRHNNRLNFLDNKNISDKKGREAYYQVDFANYHAQLVNGQFRKIVLARCADEQLEQPVDAMSLFYRACELYPRLFIALVETPQSGCWLTATPEILLDGQGNDWRTIALAGTMKLEGDQLQGEGETLTWSTKNIQEQRIVATYITECLEQFTGDFKEEGPRTVRAANLVHLRSDFTFRLDDRSHLGDLLQVLHPTPAVCGLPKREAFKFIVDNEHTPRRYYSGFMGPMGEEQTHLYVSLRCMNIEGDTCHLYAGGGLLKDSVEEQEWQETEAKMETMKRLLYV